MIKSLMCCLGNGFYYYRYILSTAMPINIKSRVCCHGIVTHVAHTATNSLVLLSTKTLQHIVDEQLTRSQLDCTVVRRQP